jgi:hypothetical protein
VHDEMGKRRTGGFWILEMQLYVSMYIEVKMYKPPYAQSTPADLGQKCVEDTADARKKK